MKQISIGRHPDNDIVINNLKVSGHHFRAYESNGKFFVEDTDSKNGVVVNNVRISEATEITTESQIIIPTKSFTGAELIGKLQTSVDTPKRELDIEQKYITLEKRYHNNMQMLCNAMHISAQPYTRVFDSIDEEMEYCVKEYGQKMDEAIAMLTLISKASRLDTISFHEDMEELANIARKSIESKKQECVEIKMRLYDKVMRLQNAICHKINDIAERFARHYQSYFIAHYETASAQEDKWGKVQNSQIVSMPYFLYGTQHIEFPIFEKTIVIKKLLFIPFLKRNNLILRYNSSTSRLAQDVINSIVGRLLASSLSNNIQLHMMDVKDLGGTSNILKMLDKHVYTINARSTDVMTELAQIDRYVENIIQNLLYGPYASLEQYNQGKEKQEPYHIVVFKDFPFGVTQEAAYTIQRILVNGSKAGIHFIFMLHEDILQRSEDCHKIATILHLDKPQELFAHSVDIIEAQVNDVVTLHYDLLDDKQLYDVVQYVNAGFEMKKDEILRLTDYMLPRQEWWTKHSANRADIPFGMSTNKQIQKLNITQESGQNSAIVIGIPGSGKSVFLHVLIANAMINYSPKELQMYLLDFSGVEFNVYARHRLPHARVIAPEAEREFGLSILREVHEEGNRRMELCREYGVTNIVELKLKNPNLVVPRLLVIIDEFQKIFEIENDNISREANDKIHAIIQEYRKFGINLILATQKLPAKSIIPYDLIANRIVFKSDPNDFSHLIHWSHSSPQPRLLTGNCVYNNESGADFSNYVTRSFFINASKELEDLIDNVVAFGEMHPEMKDEQVLRIFRSADLPSFNTCLCAEQHQQLHTIPKEVGVYVGESIAISPYHMYVPLTKDSNNNILIIGGKAEIAKGIAYHAMLSTILSHEEKSCKVALLNFMVDDDPMQSMVQTELYNTVVGWAGVFEELKTTKDVKEVLECFKDEIEARKNDSSIPCEHIYINIFEFHRGRMFDGTGSRGDMQSECARLLEYIMKNGPMVGVFTILQVDNLTNLGRLGYGAQNLFCHRIALQMSEKESDKIVGSSAANKLLVLNRPATNYRALYYNNVNNSITKFKPYRYE